jgi:nucleotide-binding universal stress UspA family protein
MPVAAAGDAPAVSTTRKPIVVGVDETEHSLAAVDWAAWEAASRAVPLMIVHCWAWQRFAPWTTGFDQLVTGDLERNAHHTVEHARKQAKTIADLAITTRVAEGYPPDVLAGLAGDATMIVLGSRHRRRAERAVLGSVSNAMAARSSCPLVVLGEPPDPPGERAGVVAGLAGSKHDHAVLAFAFDEAQRRGLPLTPMFCWHPPLPTIRPPRPELEQAHAILAEALAGWREQFPDVEVRPSAVRAHPADALIAAAAGQQLLVVGRRSRRERHGNLLGSVSLAVLHHATCPVAVVPMPPARGTAS